MDFQPYPSWRYHATEPPVMVQDPVEDEALGDGWADTPAAFLAEEATSEDATAEPDAPAAPGAAPAATATTAKSRRR